MQPVRRFLALFFLVTSTLWLVPAGLLHELTTHEDSHDACPAPGPGTSVGTEHHHCDCLQLAVPPLLPGLPPAILAPPDACSDLPVARPGHTPVPGRDACLFFRGPPAA